MDGHYVFRIFDGEILSRGKTIKRRFPLVYGPYPDKEQRNRDFLADYDDQVWKTHLDLSVEVFTEGKARFVAGVKQQQLLLIQIIELPDVFETVKNQKATAKKYQSFGYEVFWLDVYDNLVVTTGWYEED